MIFGFIGVVKLMIEPILDPVFHPDSYGYRPGNPAKIKAWTIATVLTGAPTAPADRLRAARPAYTS